MDQRSVRVVIGRGDPSRTDIRAVLENGGFTVVAEATSVEDLARLVQADPPDVVVLDDTISAAAAEAVSQLAPDTKLVVIWPAAVLPVAGATRIDATDLHTSLAPAVATAAGILLSGFTTIDRPDWIDAVRKDPATLRDKLAAGGEMPVRPSVTELQRPHGYPVATTGWRRRASRSAAVAAAAAATAAGATAPTSEETATANRRLGMVALGGAVAAGALMVALSFGQATPTLVTAEPFVPGVTAGSNYIPNPASGDIGGGTPGTAPGGTSDGTNGGTTGPVVVPVDGTNDGPGTTPGGTSGGPTVGPGTSGGGTSGGGTSGGGTPGGVKSGDRRPGKSGSSQGVPGAKGGDQGPGSTTSGAPGHSGDHNPHGGPPGQTGDHPGNGGQHPSHPSHAAQGRLHRHKR